MEAVTHRLLVQCAAWPDREARPVEEDSGVLDQPRPPVGRTVVVLAHLGEDALLLGELGVLPGVRTEPPRCLDHVVEVGLVGEVRAVAAASLDELRSRLGVDALAPAAEDALPRRQQEGDVDLPGASVVVGVGEAHPLARGTTLCCLCWLPVVPAVTASAHVEWSVARPT